MSDPRTRHLDIARQALNGRLLQTFVLADTDDAVFRVVDSERLPAEHVAKLALAKQRARRRHDATDAARTDLKYWLDLGRELEGTAGSWLGREEFAALALFALCSAAPAFRASVTLFSQCGGNGETHYFLVVAATQQNPFRFPDRFGRNTFIVDPWAASVAAQRLVRWDPARIVEALQQRPDAVVDPARCLCPEAGSRLEPLCHQRGTRFY